MRSSILPLLALAVFFPFDAWAYLERGTGSILLLVKFGGALVVAKSYWHWLKSFADETVRNRKMAQPETFRPSDRNRPAQIGLSGRCNGLEIACKVGGLFRIHGKDPLQRCANTNGI